jgi:hypothetical protein
MRKKVKQWFYITDEQIGRLARQATYPGALEALEQARKIREAGKTPSIYYSELNGFKVINEDDPEEFKIGLSIRNQAKFFRDA